LHGEFAHTRHDAADFVHRAFSRLQQADAVVRVAFRLPTSRAVNPSVILTTWGH
jgi:hypothetical protein